MRGFGHGVRLAARVMIPFCVVVYVVYAETLWPV